MQAPKTALIAAAGAAALLLLTVMAAVGWRQQRAGLLGVPLSLAPPVAHKTALKAQQLAGMVKKNKEGYNTYREMCVEGCRREGKDWPEEICGPDLLTQGWLQYARGCEEGPEDMKKCKLSKVYCNGRYHASI